jgi:hypothetical protein
MEDFMKNKLANHDFVRIIFILSILTVLTNCVSLDSSLSSSSPSINDTIVNEITTNKTYLNKEEVVEYFCYNLTEYFNSYKYYKITSEVYNEKEKQIYDSTARIIKRNSYTGTLYFVEYIGSAGWYSIAFSNTEFSESDQIHTFGRRTILGNAIRGKVYDTYCSWLYRMEIALKYNGNSDLYNDELDAALKIEEWHNNLSYN